MNECNMFVTIPLKVIEDENLSDGEKLLFGVLVGLTHNAEGKCYASDKYFCDLLKVNKSTIQLRLKNLEEAGYIERKVTYKPDSMEIDKRYIELKISIGMPENQHTPMLKNQVDNNKDNNNTISSKEDITESQIKPLEECDFNVEDDCSMYLKSRNFKVLAKYVNDCFEDAEVKDALIEFLDNCYNSRKVTLTLKQLINQVELLMKHSNSKDDALKIITETIERQYVTFKYVIQDLYGAKAPAANAAKQKITKKISQEVF